MLKEPGKGDMTTSAKILKALQTGQKLTAIKLCTQFGSTEGDRRLRELRQSHPEIQDRWVKRNGKRFKEFFIA